MKNKELVILTSLAWVGVAAAGLFFLFQYSNTPGELIEPPSQWPANANLARTPNLATLVLFGHPHCPCSKASVGELNEIVAKVNQRVDVHVVFIVPKQADEDWRNTDLWGDARMVPGAHTSLDENGVLANMFGARTSGEVLLYDQKGNLVFAGGITSARGHFGDNVGKSSIISYLNTGQILSPKTPVFGCALYREPDQFEEHQH